jgi:hypothetical protein
MRNVTSIYNRQVLTDAELTVVLCSTDQAPQKIAQATPYALININRTTLIERQIKTIRNIFPRCEILVVAGYDAHKVYNKLKTKNIRIIYNPNFDVCNSLYSFGMGLYNNINPQVIYIDGNTLFDEQAIGEITLNRQSSVLAVNKTSDNLPGITIDNSNHISFFAMGLKIQWGNIAYITRSELLLLEKHALNPKCYNNYLYEGLNKVIESGGNIIAHTPPQYKLTQILQYSDLEKAKKIFV